LVNRENPVERRENEIGPSDLVLMRSMARGERSALSSLYERHGGLALTLAMRMLGDADTAEEVVQDAFVAVWRRAADFRPEAAAPRTWLLAIVRNRCIDELRRRPLAARVPLDDAQPPAIEGDPWPDIWKRQCGDVLRAALRELPSEQRNVIELGFFGGLSHAQIAARVDAPLGTIKKRMRSGLKRLRLALDASYADALP
jgi:RNA polymerase sigma-70 factor (ECF subfamily)